MAARVPLSGDEGYYWLWSRHLAWGYYDHPPMVAWVIRLTTSLLGTSELTTRLGAIVSLALIPLILARLALDCGGGWEAAAATGFLCLATPTLVVEGGFITPNSPFLLFWTLALWLYHRALVLQHRRWRDWILAGAMLGCAALGKLMALLFLPSLLLFALLSPVHRPLLRNVRAWASLGTSALVFLPYVWWNASHDWEDFRYQLFLRHLVPDVKYSGIWHFAMLQAASISPVLLGVGIVAVVASLRRRGSPLFLGCMAAGTIGFFSLCACVGQVELYWTVGGWLAAFVSISLWAFETPQGVWWKLGRRRRWAVASGVLIPGLFITSLVYAGPFFPRVTLFLATLGHPPGFRGNGVTELYSYPLLAQDLVAPPGTFVVSDSYALSAVLSFYQRGYVHTMPGNLQGQEWRRWERPEALRGEDAIYLDREPLSARPDIRRRLLTAFDAVGDEVERDYWQDGVPTASYWEVHCKGFHGSW
jgi:4-amino-4-deoxy-L-arabinose transferase-like glycosyltransferase